MLNHYSCISITDGIDGSYYSSLKVFARSLTVVVSMLSLFIEVFFLP